MEIPFDTANLAAIEAMTPIYPVSGVTTNPTIIRAEGRIDFYPHFRRIRELIGPDRTLHVQVLAQDSEGIIRDAHRLREMVDEHGADCKIMAASFKNVAQVSAAFEAGAQAVTLPPQLLRAALSTPDVAQAVSAFANDWYETFGTTTLP